MSYGEAVDSLFRFIREARSEFSLETEKPVPFRWNIYRRRPQLRDNLAARIVREIIDGEIFFHRLSSLPAEDGGAVWGCREYRTADHERFGGAGTGGGPAGKRVPNLRRNASDGFLETGHQRRAAPVPGGFAALGADIAVILHTVGAQTGRGR